MEIGRHGAMAKVGNRRSLVIFQPSGRRGYIEEGKTVKEASRKLGVDIEGICGDKATCGKCKIRIEEGFFEKYGIESRMGHLSPIGESERKFFKAQEERDGYRLACQAGIHGDMVVFIPRRVGPGSRLYTKRRRRELST